MIEDAAIRLTAREMLYLKNSAFLIERLADLVAKAAVENGGYILTVPSELVEEFRSAFTERLAVNGFDAEYKVTAEGQMLERLIDKFYQSIRLAD
jgi:hypothetical protein